MWAYCLQLGPSTSYLTLAGFLHLCYVPCTFSHLNLRSLGLNKEQEEKRQIDGACQRRLLVWVLVNRQKKSKSIKDRSEEGLGNPGRKVIASWWAELEATSFQRISVLNPDKENKAIQVNMHLQCPLYLHSHYNRHSVEY